MSVPTCEHGVYGDSCAECLKARIEELERELEKLKAERDVWKGHARAALRELDKHQVPDNREETVAEKRWALWHVSLHGWAHNTADRYRWRWVASLVAKWRTNRWRKWEVRELPTSPSPTP